MCSLKNIINIIKKLNRNEIICKYCITWQMLFCISVKLTISCVIWLCVNYEICNNICSNMCVVEKDIVQAKHHALVLMLIN